MAANASNRPIITGSWLDFHHPNFREGDYWNDTTRRFSAQDWDRKVAEMAGLGMDTLVLLSVALRGASFYPSRHFARRWDLLCEDPVEAVLAAADRHGMKVFVGVGYFAHHTGDHVGDAEDKRLRAVIPQELVERYGHPLVLPRLVLARRSGDPGPLSRRVPRLRQRTVRILPGSRRREAHSDRSLRHPYRCPRCMLY